MGKIVFLNPNDPEQPRQGVYIWFCRKDASEFTVYVGNSGVRKEAIGAPSTLLRGVMEAKRSCVTSNKGRSLDTDYIVGTAIRYFTKKGYDCCWKHIANEPSKEKTFCNDLQPLLQGTNGRILAKFKLTNASGILWLNNQTALAEKSLFKVFNTEFHAIP